jgi:hypothetical protein
MMLTPPRQRGRESNRPLASASRRRWALISTVEPLEGRQLLANAVASVLPSPTGSPPAQVAAAPPVAQGQAPQVESAQFEPLTGRILVQFSADAAGYDPAVLTNPANYSFSLLQAFEKQPTKSQSRPKAGIVLPPPYVVTGVTLTNPTTAGMPPSVIVSINNNEPLRFGVYQFTIHSAGLTDLAGRRLNGFFDGGFPTGSEPGVGDFVAILAEVNSTVLPPLTASPPTAPDVPPGVKPPASSTKNPPGINPTYVFLPSTRGVRIRYTSASPGQFVLAGGNKITLKPLRNQYFPGTYRLPALDASLIPGAKKHPKPKKG